MSARAIRRHITDARDNMHNIGAYIGLLNIPETTKDELLDIAREACRDLADATRLISHLPIGEPDQADLLIDEVTALMEAPKTGSNVVPFQAS